MSQCPVYPKILIAAKKAGCLNPYRFWSLIYPVCNPNIQYSSKLVKEQMAVLLRSSVRSSYEILAAGDGVFWSYSRGSKDHTPGRISFFPPEKVAGALGLEDPGSCTEVSRFAFQDPKTWRSAMYARVLRWVDCASPTPHTRARLKELTGVSPRQQYNYEKIAGVSKRSAYVVTSVDGDSLGSEREHPPRGPYKASKVHIHPSDGSPVISFYGVFRQIGNSYYGAHNGSDSLMRLGKYRGDIFFAPKELCGKLLSHNIPCTLSNTSHPPEAWYQEIPVDSKLSSPMVLV